MTVWWWKKRLRTAGMIYVIFQTITTAFVLFSQGIGLAVVEELCALGAQVRGAAAGAQRGGGG